MRINQNISALNAYRNMVSNENRLNKSLERLSSGLRINRAADDAAGLAISEKMRGQIRGLNQAMSNAQDGISLIQTAEGALNETHSILQRMRELSVQAANDTLTAGDRMEIQKEIDQLTSEVNRIANTTEFNTKKLLDGTTSALTSTDNLKTKVFMRDGLRTIDQFGQKEVGGGNFKLEIKADPGEGQVQKTDIMKIKHGTDYTINPDSGITSFSAENLRYGEYTVATEVGDTVAANADSSIVALFEGYSTSSALVSDPTTPLQLDLSGTFAVKITEVRASDNEVDYEIHYSFYSHGGTLNSGVSTGTITGLDGTGTTHQNETIGTSGFSIDFRSNDVSDYTVGESGVFALNTGNEDGSVPISVDNVIISAGDYKVDVNGTDYTAESDSSAVATFSFNPGGWNNSLTELEVIQLDAENNFITAKIEITAEGLAAEGAAVEFDFEGEVGQKATLDTALSEIDRFWDASGNFLVKDPQTITIVQGDGSETSFTIFGTDTILDIQDKLNNAIHEGLGQNEVNKEEPNAYVQYVQTFQGEDSDFFTVEGTYIIQSAITGSDGELNFIGNESLLNALSLTTIQEASETQYTVNVTDAHKGTVIAEDVGISGNMLVGVVHKNVDVAFDAMAGMDFKVTDGAFEWDAASEAHETFVHLADNSMVFHIGANQLQDVDAAIGDMRAEALGVDNILVTNRSTANDAIGTIDNAINRVSAERSKMGALQNRLEHTISNLGVAAENLTAAESRIRDLDFALEMVEFTRNQIMQQAATSMLAQANMKPQSVLMLLG